MTKHYFIKTSLIIIVCLFILTGCSIVHKIDQQNKINNLPLKTGPENNIEDENIVKATTTSIAEQLAAQSKIKKFKDYEELKGFLEQADFSPSYGYGSLEGRMYVEKMTDEAGPSLGQSFTKSLNLADAAPSAGESQTNGDFSKTNVQVEGVDEADIIKTDGNFIYAVSRNNLFIISAKPADNMEILAKIEFKARPQDLYINGNKLVVFGSDSAISQTEIYKRFRRYNPYTFFKVFDISDKKNPKQERDLDFEGSYNNSRMIGDYVYFITANHNYYYVEGEPVIPRILDGGVELPLICAGGDTKCFAPDVYYFDIPYNSYNFTTITAINVKDSTQNPAGEAYLMSGSQNIYASPNNIYITYTKYVSEYQLEMEAMRELIYPRLSKSDRDKIDKIEATENYILNIEEKKQKISQIIERYGASLTSEEQTKLEEDLNAKMKEKYLSIADELEKTVIQKIKIDKEKIEYKATGEVPGQVLNQFSMDENGGYFRIATTRSQTWSRFEEANRESISNLFVLDEALRLAGSLREIAPGERIYSVRFMQSRAYLVTFKQTDPLFVIDLKDPNNPKILGKLKIPGFSNYLHPYDESTLIGIGKETAENQWGGVTTKGLKLSLFDVSKVEEPKEIDTYVLGDAGSDSIALYDHKAFLFSLNKNLLAIPVSINEKSGANEWGRLVFSGAAVFTVDKEGFKLKGRIDHSNGGKSSPVDYWDGYNYYDNTVKRSLYIEDTLYTFSNNYLKANQLSDLKSIKDLELIKNPTNNDDYKIIN